ncbi:hypothetical protein ILUMI_12779 [Ignelater luminosus]|uniref:Uncharacterized protein n=1 Tax=Ignelater luminosus TaxID=2038154 RepID=A0A8K0G6G1_IGNLU|nr:hypothetical protein ILUMI_12779 [Ignelater luminosus]
MVVINPYYRCLGLAAAIIGIIQGLVWFILALIAILIHTKAWEPTSDISTYGHLLSTTIIRRFLIGDHPTLVYVGPLQFFTCVVIYLVASLFWTVLSSLQFWVVFREKPTLLRKAFVGWASWAIILCIYDLVWASLLAYDYDQVVQQMNKKDVSTKQDYVVILAHGIIMTLVARGFVLWIVNLIVAIFILKLAFTVPKEINENDINSNIINAFDTTPKNWQDTKPNLARSNSFMSSQSFGTFQGLPRLPPVQSTNESLARLSRSLVPRSPTVTNNASPTRSNSFLYPDRRSSLEYSAPRSPSRPVPPLKPALKNRFQNSYG